MKKENGRYAAWSHLDWLSVSYSASPNDRTPIERAIGGALHDLLAPKEPVSGMRIYDRGFLLECGGRFYNSSVPGVGGLLELGGKALKSFREYGESDAEILDVLTVEPDLIKNVTRIDYAFNINVGSINALLARVERGEYSTRTRTEPEHVGPVDRGAPGHTIYFGSRKAEKRLCIYDKAAEQKLLGEVWNRIEVRLKKPYAGAAVGEVVTGGATLEEIMRGQVKRLANFEGLFWWDWALAGSTAKLPPVGIRHDKFYRWLVSQVQPAIINRCLRDAKLKAHVFNMLQDTIMRLYPHLTPDDGDYEPEF